MKRYLLFEMYQYYPAGGLGDVVKEYDTIEEALADPPNESPDAAYIWDRIEDKTWDSKCVKGEDGKYRMKWEAGNIRKPARGSV